MTAQEQAREWVEQQDAWTRKGYTHGSNVADIIRSLLAELEEVQRDATYLAEEALQNHAVCAGDNCKQGWKCGECPPLNCTCPACEVARKYKR